ncbi:MAG: transporter, ATP-binding protein-related protein [Clostridia bacterium]|jgi:hypothetical protein|nr:transporter, ATP-binding protein-related protein [Clostridia bacterium]
MGKKKRNVQLNKEYIQELCESYGLPDYVVKKYNKVKVIILCEGSKTSFDYLIYSKVYPTALILPSNGNMDVINKTKGLRKKSNMFYGIVDGDGLNFSQRQVLENDGIYCLGVYAIENLLAIDEVVLMIMKYLKITDSIQILSEVKTKAFCLTQENDKHLDFNNILLQIDPKKIIGIIINAIGAKDSGWKYKETFFNLLEQNSTKETLLSHIRKYTPIIEQCK